MGHYAKIRQGKVVEVIVADASFFNNFVDSSPGKWIKTSYNTRQGVHYQANSNDPSPIVYSAVSQSVSASVTFTHIHKFDTEAEASSSIADGTCLSPITESDTSKTLALRGNYAGIGYEYDGTLDAFFAPKPFNSWVKDTASFSYEAPIDYPTGDLTGSYTGSYLWDEDVYNADSGNPKTEGWVTSSLVP